MCYTERANEGTRMPLKRHSEALLVGADGEGIAFIMQPKIEALLKANKFDEATELLRSHLSAAELLNPRNDRTWKPYADHIGFTIRERKDRAAESGFWQDLLKFFVADLEPKWMHLHKGHIFFRLGFSTLHDDMSKAVSFFEKALEEDRVLESAGLGDGAQLAHVEKAVQRYSAYVALSILETIQNEQFDSPAERQRFVQAFSVSFDAAIQGKQVEPAQLGQGLAIVVPKNGLQSSLKILEELDKAINLQMAIATVSLCGALLESVLLGILYHQRGLSNTSKGENILKVQLGKLLNEATRIEGFFPSSSIRAVCELVHIFRNRLHPGNEIRQKYKLTFRVANTLSILLRLALMEWRKNLSE